MSLWFAYLAGLGTIPLLCAVACVWVMAAEWRKTTREDIRKHDRDNEKSFAA